MSLSAVIVSVILETTEVLFVSFEVMLKTSSFADTETACEDEDDISDLILLMACFALSSVATANMSCIVAAVAVVAAETVPVFTTSTLLESSVATPKSEAVKEDSKSFITPVSVMTVFSGVTSAAGVVAAGVVVAEVPPPPPLDDVVVVVVGAELAQTFELQ